MDEWLTAVANVGFPICITFYLIVRIENKMDVLTAAINSLTNRIGENK